MAAATTEPDSSRDPPAASSSAVAAAGVGGPNPCCAKVSGPLSVLSLTPHSISFSRAFPVPDAMYRSLFHFLWGSPQLWRKYQKVEHSRNLLREAVRLLETESKKLREENSELSKGMIFLPSKMLSLNFFPAF
jgi:hypothetical protein